MAGDPATRQSPRAGVTITPRLEGAAVTAILVVVFITLNKRYRA